MNWLPEQQLIEQNTAEFQKDLNSIKEYCREYPNIELFVQLLIGGLLSDSKSDKYELAHELSALLYWICGFDIRSALMNPFHYQGNWLHELNAFIGNYFLDDSCFTVELEGGRLRARSAGDEGTQDPMVLIAAARKTREYYKHAEQLQGTALKEYIRRGIESFVFDDAQSEVPTEDKKRKRTQNTRNENDT